MTTRKGAIVHLIRWKDNEIPLIKELEEKYPGLTKQLKRGDLIENLNESGYRSNGVFMVDMCGGELVIVDLDRDFDDYGSPANMFAISDFPLNYYDNDQMVANETYEHLEGEGET